MAGASTICIAAASGTVEPQVQLAAHEESPPVRVVTSDYTLAASVNPLALAELPFKYYFTIASTLGNLAAFVPPVNSATGAFFQGQFEKIPPLLQQAVAAEAKAIQAVIALPTTLVSGLSAVTTSNALAKDVASPAAATPTASAGGLVPIAELPFQLYFTVASTLGNLAAFVAPINSATGAFFQGQFEKIPPLLQTAFTNELAAINKVLALPATVASMVGNALSGGVTASALTTGRSNIELQALSAALSTPTKTEKSTTDKAESSVTDSDATKVKGSGATTPKTTSGSEAHETGTSTTGTATTGTTGTDTSDTKDTSDASDTKDAKDTSDAKDAKVSGATGTKHAGHTEHKKGTGDGHASSTKKAQHRAGKK
jgi:hypothetical protein